MVLLLLPTAPEGTPSEPQIHATIAPPLNIVLEAAGRPFEAYLRERLRRDAGSDDESSSSSEDEDDNRRAQQKGGKHKHDGKSAKEKREKPAMVRKLTEDELQQDHYAILDLAEFQIAATDEQIKAAYKRLVVETHPDKTGGGDDTRFKAVQKAYEVLGDPQKRAAYDSSLPFDDDIPPMTSDPEEFFEEFGPVFASNARWSTTPIAQVPLLGGPDTPWQEVERFYNFWNRFKSWRDFSHVDEHNIEEADSRDEKRWMESNNQRLRNRAKKEEVQRIQTLVDRAYKCDPRVKIILAERRKEQERKEKEREKEKRKKQMEEQRKIERELAEKRKAEEARIAEEKRKVEEFKRTKQAIKQYLGPFLDQSRNQQPQEDKITNWDLDYFLDRVKAEALYPLKEKADKTAQEKGETPPPVSVEIAKDMIGAINGLIAEMEKAAGVDRFDRYLKKYDPTAAKKKEATVQAKDVWTEQELADLTKATAKFPGGCFNRWENISNFVGTKTPDQVIRKMKELTGQLNEMVPPTKPKEIKQADAKVAAKFEEGGEGTSGGATATTTVEDLWTKDQQKQLEDALKQLKDYKEKDKWDKVAAMVTGKNKKQVVERYKYLANMFKKK